MENIENKTVKVSIIVPLQQHSYKTARGLISGGLIDRYYTSVYYKNAGIYRLLNILLPEDLKKRMHVKCDENVSPFVKKHKEFLGLVFLYALRSRFMQKFYPTVWTLLVNSCGKLAAKDFINRQTSIAWSYDTMARSAFSLVHRKNPKAICILDMASTSVTAIKKIVEEEYTAKNPFYETFERHLRLYSKSKCLAFRQELHTADYVVVASNYVRNSILDEGIQPNKIKYLPLGVDASTFTPKDEMYSPNSKLKFLFVGRMEGAKGIYYLIEGFRQMQDLNVELIAVGENFELQDKFTSYTSNIKVLGVKRRDEMNNVYKNADVYILPSLWEGFSFSLMEALASGLPVIASKYSCAPEVVEDYKEGFVIEPRNIEDIKEKVKWFVDNKDKIKDMGKAARAKAEIYSWDNYSQNVVKIIKEIQDEKLNGETTAIL
jgi:glycosyltransferase involved in cell wall biosynthesis